MFYIPSSPWVVFLTASWRLCVACSWPYPLGRDTTRWLRRILLHAVGIWSWWKWPPVLASATWMCIYFSQCPWSTFAPRFLTFHDFLTVPFDTKNYIACCELHLFYWFYSLEGDREKKSCVLVYSPATHKCQDCSGVIFGVQNKIQSSLVGGEWSDHVSQHPVSPSVWLAGS